MSSQALVPVRKKSRHSDTAPSPSEETQSPKNTDIEAVKAETDQLLDEIDRVLDQEAIQHLRDKLKDFDPSEERPLSLADLMREGSSVTSQAIGAWTRPTGETCALSAAMLAARARGLA